jgi:hypothetical protein
MKARDVIKTLDKMAAILEPQSFSAYVEVPAYNFSRVSVP